MQKRGDEKEREIQRGREEEEREGDVDHREEGRAGWGMREDSGSVLIKIETRGDGECGAQRNRPTG